MTITGMRFIQPGLAYREVDQTADIQGFLVEICSINLVTLIVKLRGIHYMDFAFKIYIQKVLIQIIHLPVYGG